MKRPGPVTFLAILNFLWAIPLSLGGFLIGFVIMPLGGLAAGGHHVNPTSTSEALNESLKMTPPFLVLAGTFVLAGVGLLRLRNWARILTIVVAAITLAGALVVAVFVPFSLVVGLFNGAVIVYLVQPDVKNVFLVKR